MSYEEMVVENIADIKEDLRAIKLQLDKSMSRFDKLEVVVKGNGTVGHEQRLGALEAWQKTRPIDCPAKPLSKGERWKIRASEAAIIGVFISIVNFLIFSLPRLIK